MKFRKRPIVVEAEQWFVGRKIEGVYYDQHKKTYCVDALEGTLEVSVGDWIITGIKGERYPCDPDIFKLTYEVVE